MTAKNYLKARAPAKIILSGEHAVVYGHPALAMAINRYTETLVRWSTPLHLTFNLLGIDYKQKITLEALKRLKRKLQKQYHQFSTGEISIRDVLKHPFELTLYTAMNVIEKLKHKLPMGIDINTHSNIPIGCGLGSSAACVVSVIKALGHFLHVHLQIQDYIRLGIESENLQHGFSSGLDIHISYQGGALFFQNGQCTSRPLPTFPMQLVLTGQPQSSTGECVQQAKQRFNTSKIGKDFEAITLDLDAAIQANDLTHIKRNLSENHRLLQHIGVVPTKVSHFIHAIEKRNGAAKICGAGTIRGDAAGVILVVCEEDITTLSAEHGYSLMPIKGDSHGATLL
ncbi:MAG: mevalonate kinase [Coxiella sp. RIFCSPHIGHO2_12_FULL_42_15]|nr:MAG: mevalonate kinase [Coxiella sp. RIFCSPHIGHO2_12_FULL_42_15]